MIKHRFRNINFVHLRILLLSLIPESGAALFKGMLSQKTVPGLCKDSDSSLGLHVLGPAGQPQRTKQLPADCRPSNFFHRSSWGHHFGHKYTFFSTASRLTEMLDCVCYPNTQKHLHSAIKPFCGGWQLGDDSTAFFDCSGT